MTPKKKYKNFEEAIARLEEITELLESGNVSLEDSLKLYSESLEISDFCYKKLTEAEKKIKIISEKDNKMTEILMDEEE